MDKQNKKNIQTTGVAQALLLVLKRSTH